MNSLKFRNFAEKRKMWKFKVIELEDAEIGNISNKKAIIHEVSSENIVEIFIPSNLGPLDFKKSCIDLLTVLGIKVEEIKIDSISIKNNIKMCEVLDINHIEQEYGLNISDTNIRVVTPIYTNFEKIKISTDIYSDIHIVIPIYMALSKIILDYQQADINITVKNSEDIISFDGELVFITDNLKIYPCIYNADGCPIFPQKEEEKIYLITDISPKETVKIYGNTYIPNLNDNQAYIILLIPSRLEDYEDDSLEDLGLNSLFDLSFKEQN